MLVFYSILTQFNLRFQVFSSWNRVYVFLNTILRHLSLIQTFPLRTHKNYWTVLFLNGPQASLRCMLFSKLVVKGNKNPVKTKTGKDKKVFLPSLSYFLKIWRNFTDVILDFPWKWSNIGEAIVHQDKIWWKQTT